MPNPITRVFTMGWLLAMALLLATQAAHAQRAAAGIEQGLTPAQLHAAGLDSLTPAQLQALNALIDARTAQATRIQATASNGTSDANGAPVGAGAPDPDRSFIGLNDKPIHSRLKGSISSWEPGTEFVLENGQVWKVLKGFYKIRKPMDAPEIVVVPGVAGRWFLQVDEDFPKARVYRID